MRVIIYTDSSKRTVENTILASSVNWLEMTYPGRWELGEEVITDLKPQRKLTHLAFRRLFTQAEREDLDELEADFVTMPGLTGPQKKILRSGFKDYNMATEIDLDDPAVTSMLRMFVALGRLTAGRAAVVLTGVAP